jgi:hypothetical protein
MKDPRKKRVLIEEDVLINRTIRAEGLDLSEDGMYIYTQTYFLPDSIINVSFNIGGELVEVSAKIQHAQPGVGLGVKFFELPKDTLRKIREYLSTR